jgi:acyl carrier protein
MYPNSAKLPIADSGRMPDQSILAGANPPSPEDAQLREALKRCSTSTFEAARQLRRTGNIEYLPAFIAGVIERFVEPDRRGKLKHPADDLHLIEDLGLDSLTLMEIVLLAEDVLPISIPNEELRQLRTVGEVRRYIEVKLARRPD